MQKWGNTYTTAITTNTKGNKSSSIRADICIEDVAKSRISGAKSQKETKRQDGNDP